MTTKNPYAVRQQEYRGHFVSTVELAFGLGLPFETMIFPGAEGDDWLEIYCDRYATREQAIAGHAEALAWLDAMLDNPSDS